MNRSRAIAFGLTAVVAMGLVVSMMSVGRIVKAGVESLGPRITKTSVKLGGAWLSPFSGTVRLSDFILGNPEGFDTPAAISVRRFKTTLDVRSLWSDQIRIREIVIDRPEIWYETGPGGTNLKVIQRNVAGGTGKGAESTGSSRKMSIERVVIRNGVVHFRPKWMVSGEMRVDLPSIELRNIGTGSNGVSAADAVSRVFQSITAEVIVATAGTASQTVKDVGRGIRNLIGR